MGKDDGFRKPDDVTSDEALSCWDAVAAEYEALFGDGEETWHKLIINPCVMEVVGRVDGKVVLDLACGEGHLARRLAAASKGTARITGVDGSANMIRMAREKSRASADGVSFLVADASAMPEVPAAAFDLVVCNMALMDIKDYAAAIREVARVLKPGGEFVFSILHPCFITAGSGWIKKDPHGSGPENKIGWKVDNYHLPLAAKAPLKPRMKCGTYLFHRTLEDYMAALRQGGFVIADLREPGPSKEQIEQDPGLGPDLKMSFFLVVKCVLAGAR